MRILTILTILLLSLTSVFAGGGDTCKIVRDVSLGECEGAKMQFISSEHFQVFASPDGMSWTDQVDNATVNYDVTGGVIAFDSENGLVTFDGIDVGVINGSDSPYYIIYYKTCKTCVYNGFNKTLCSEFGCTVLKCNDYESDPCEGVMCEPPLICEAGECVDTTRMVMPCDTVMCMEGEVCEAGECLPQIPSLVLEKQANTELTTEDGTPAYQDGTQYSYTITVTNDGDVPQTNVTVFEQMPEGVVIVSDDGGGNYVEPNWTVGDLAVGETKTLTIKVMPMTDGDVDISNTVSVKSNELPDAIETESILPERPCTECWKFLHFDNGTFFLGEYIPVSLPDFTNSHTGQGSVMMGINSGQGIIPNQYFWNIANANAVGLKRNQEYSITMTSDNCTGQCNTDIRFKGEKKGFIFDLVDKLGSIIEGIDLNFGTNSIAGTGANLPGGFGAYAHGTPVGCASCELEYFRVSPVVKGEINHDIWIEIVVGYTQYQLCETSPENLTSLGICEVEECGCAFQLLDHNNGNEPITEGSLNCKGEYHLVAEECTNVTSIILSNSLTSIQGEISPNGTGVLTLNGIEEGNYNLTFLIDGCDEVTGKISVKCQ